MSEVQGFNQYIRGITAKPAIFYLMFVGITGCSTTSQSPGAANTFPTQCTPDLQGVNSGMSLDQDMDNRPPALITVLGIERCVGYQLQRQQLRGVAGLTIFPRGEENTINTCVPDIARYNADAHPVARQIPSGDCVAAGSVAFPIELRFALNYRAVWTNNTNGGGLCIYRSRVDYNRFDVTNLERVDDVIQRQVREDIHHQIDFTAASELNQRTILAGASGSALNDGDEPRCSDWSELAP